MNITRRIHLNPQSKGNLGKSFEAEFRTAWLDQLGVQWNGSDLDDRHHTFASRHKDAVRSYQLGNEHESKTALLSLFRRVLKDTAPEELLAAIRVLAAGDALLAPGITRRLIREFAGRPEPGAYTSPALLDPLSAREREVLVEVAGGWSNTEIGERLHISAATAKTHVSRLLMKLAAHDRAQLVMIAYETGLVTPG